MICPECHKGKIPDPTPNRARKSKDYGKVVPCQRCNGSGFVSRRDKEVVSEGTPIHAERSGSKDSE